MIERHLTTEQVANILQIHPFTVLKLLKTGKLRGAKIGRVYRIKESDVHEFLEQRTVGGATPKKEKKKKIEKVEEEFKVNEGKNESNDEESHYYVI